MCGIAGKLDWNHPPDSEIVQMMCNKMIHRGPDDSGIVQLPHITLGHRRLSIIDLSKYARQPMVSKDGRYYIVYNGEVYNFKELKKELEKEGFVFNTSSDTEVVLNSYIQWGTKCLSKFNGMFAFAIWDNLRNALFLARDRFGQKPLYYYRDPKGGVTFASELTALLCDTTIPQKISYTALNCYLALGYILAPLTLYEDIYKLEPASFLFVSNGGNIVEKKKYWDYADAFRIKSRQKEEDMADNVISLLRKSVKRRMVSDVPIGAFLSGGIDSSSVVRIMKDYHQGELHTCCLGFKQKSYDESDDANRLAEFIGTNHHQKICLIDHALADEAIDAYDEPFADTSLIPTCAVAKLASGFFKVVLSGDGADELFAGYITYKADKYYYKVRYLPDAFKKAMVWWGNKPIKKKLKKLSFKYKQKQFFYGTLHSPEKAHYLWRIMFHPEERIAILGETYRELVYDTDPFALFQKYYKRVESLHWLDKNLYVDGMTWLTDDVLVKVDRASMRNSIEARCPYLDVDLANYVASLPPNMKMNGLVSKYILRKGLKREGLLPKFVLKKKKSGFNAPVGAWIGYSGIDEFKTFNKYVLKRKVKVG